MAKSSKLWDAQAVYAALNADGLPTLTLAIPVAGITCKVTTAGLTPEAILNDMAQTPRDVKFSQKLATDDGPLAVGGAVGAKARNWTRGPEASARILSALMGIPTGRTDGLPDSAPDTDAAPAVKNGTHKRNGAPAPAPASV